MDRHDVGSSEQDFFVDQGCACSTRGFLREILASGEHFHAERDADAGDLLSDVAQADYAQGLAAKVSADGGLPAAIAHGCGFPIEVSHARQDQRPGELDRGSGILAGGGDRDTEVVRGLRVDGGVAGSRRGDQLELRQLLQDLPCERSAFAHDADHVEGAKPLNHCRGIGDVAVEHADLRPATRETARGK